MNDKAYQGISKNLRDRGKILIFGAVLVGCAVGQAQVHIPSFSADQVQVTRGKTINSKVYATEKAVRTESIDKGKQKITILRLDQKAVWVLDPVQKTYMDMGSLGTASMELANSATDAKRERQSLGSEQVGAYHCDKYRVQTTWEGHVYTSVEWDAKELDGLPVKQADEKGSWSKEYQNVQLGPQDPSLFEVPPDYKKIDLGALFKPRS